MAPITAFYAGLLGLLYVALAIRVIHIRGRAGVSLGAGEDASLQRAIRVHGNFAEYVPLALVLMMLAELGRAPAWLLQGAGAALLVGRLFHAWGVGQIEENHRYRVVGMALTFISIIGLALSCLRGALLG